MPKLSEEFVGACLKMSDSEKSKLTDSERELYGQSSIKLKTFLNNVCSKDNTRYLELGVYRGSTIISAMYGNKTLQAVGVENFKFDKKEPQYFLDEGWPNMKSQMYDVFQKYQFVDDVNTNNLKIIESDFEEVSWSSQSKFDVIFMDIDPITPEIYDNFFKKVFNAFSRQSVVIFSGYSSEEIAPLLEQKVEQYSDRLVTEFKFQKISSGNADSFGYYSGIVVYGFRKKAFAKND